MQETKQLMEGEVKRLKVELEVYTGTLVELRNNLTREGERSAGLQARVKELEKDVVEHEAKGKESEDLDAERKKVRFERQSLTPGELGQERMTEIRAEVEQEVMERQKQELARRKQELEEEAEQELARRVESSKLEAAQQQEHDWEARLSAARTSWTAVQEAASRAAEEEAVARARLEWLRALPEAQVTSCTTPSLLLLGREQEQQQG